MPRNRPLRLVYALIVVIALALIGRNLYRHTVNKALLAAVRIRDVAAVSGLLARGADPNYRFTVSTPDGHPAPLRPILQLAFAKIVQDHPITNGALRSDTVFLPEVPNAQAEAIALLLIRNGAAVQEGSYLTWACSLGDVSLTRVLLERGVDPNTHDNSGALDSAINYALGVTYISTVPLLMARTPAQKAELARRQEVSRQLVQLLREHGAKLSLMQAQALGDAATVQKLLAAGGAGLEQDGYLAMSKAAQTGDMQTLNQLIKQGIDPRRAPPPGTMIIIGPRMTYMEPLQAAVAGNHMAAAELLLQHGADPNAASRPGGPTALGFAVGTDNLDMIKLLVAHGAKVNPTGSDAPLAAAIRRRHPIVVRYLLEQGADANGAADPFAATVLREALQYLPEVVPDLLQHGARVNLPDNPGREEKVELAPYSPLMAAVFYAPQDEALLKRAGATIGRDRSGICVAAVWQNRLDLLPKLLAYGADINGMDTSGDTALLVCIDHTPAYVRTLLEHGANPNVLSHNRRTPLQEAAMIGNIGVVRLLLAHGADVNARVVRGHTALEWARKKNHADIVTLLQQAGAKE